MSFGIVPAGYSVLLWAPLLSALVGLFLWLLWLAASQRRSAGANVVRFTARMPALGVELMPGLALAAGMLTVAALFAF